MLELTVTCTFLTTKYLLKGLQIIRQIFLTLANDQLDAHIFSTFITILYTYMFRAISCSSSGSQNVLI